MIDMALLTNKYGQKIWSETNSHIADAILKIGIYDEHAIHYIEKILKSLHDPVVLDIGSHIGNHALVMTKFSQTVYCFEPMPENVATLTRNQHENQITNLHIFNVGLSDKNETLTFYKEGSTFVSELQHDNSQTETLVCRVGDEVLRENQITRVDFIKIDIEGFEARALYGLRETIRQSRPVIIMEWNNDSTREQFQKYDLFHSVFTDYDVRAISHNHHKYYLGKHWYTPLLRFVYRKFTKKQRMLTSFYPEVDYTNVLLIPKEKTLAVGL